MSDDATDAITAALWNALTGDTQLGAFFVSLFGAQGASNGGVWNMQADDETPPPFLRLRALAPTYDYCFGSGVATSERYPVEVMAWAEDRPTVKAATLCAQLVAHARRILTDADLTVSGYTLLLCRPYAGIPPFTSQGPNARDQIGQGVRFEIVVTQ